MGNPNSELRTPNSQNGVALIITLILLGVVTFMAITFLALSRRERSAVATVTDTAGARLAADAALANAEAQVMANVLATTNPYNFTLLVSTNYINPLGFRIGVSSYTNVNYDHEYNSSTPLTPADFLQNLINLFYSPRPPVFIPTNSAGSNDFRFYLDLNRNGRDDPNGLQLVISPNLSKPYYDTNGNLIPAIIPGNTLSNMMVGDPEWIGVLERPDAPHGPNNKFIARYAFIAVPVGNTLDLNAIHNQAHWPSRTSGALPVPPSVNPSSTGNRDNFVRNESVGSWEINLGAFLTDLNTNEWDNSLSGIYQYPPSGFNNPVAAFDDARALLAYRYNNDFRSLASVKNLYGTVNANAFGSDHIDGYTYGQPLFGTAGIQAFQLPTDNDSALNGILNPFSGGSPWVGANNTNHFFSHQDLFNTNNTEWGAALPGFTDRLLQAGTNVSTYDRYTFYRLLAQLGTDSTPDSGKMNLNYQNVDTNGNIVRGMETNFISWTPLAFFTNAADRLLRAYTTQWRNSNPTNFATTFYWVTNFNSIIASQWTTNYLPFGITNIPVLISNRFVYSSAVNRLLQLAANMYDATTNNTFRLGNNYPSVFRPTFWVTNEFGYKNVYINGYEDVSDYSQRNILTVGNPPLDTPTNVDALPYGIVSGLSLPTRNVYGVPWIIGAKKGFPNFNELSMESIVQTTRKLQVTRTVTNLPPQYPQYATNQMYVFSITNSIGVECLNSYATNYPNPVQIVVYDNLTMTLTNAYPGTLVVSSNYVIQTFTTVNPWPGSIWGYGNALQSNPFIIPLRTNVVFMPDSVYSFQNENFTPVTPNSTPPWETNILLTILPHFGLATTNRFQLFMLDQDISGNYHVIDYVQLAGPDSLRDINAELTNPDRFDSYGMWQTNLLGVQNQLNLSEGITVPDSVPDEDGGQWVKPQVSGIITIPQMQAYFNGLFMTNNVGHAYGWDADSSPSATEMNLSYGTQAPYTPTRNVVQYISWQANDPLVHYVASDLNYSGTEQRYGGPSTGITNNDRTAIPMLPDLGNVNDRYQPWGMTSQMTELANVSTNAFDLAFKDPLVRRPDNWDFPTTKWPGIGWLGRVHRGTPWQSVYLKASDVLKEVQINGGTINYIGTNTWVQWTGDAQLTYGQYFDADNNAPVQDRLLFDLFTTAFNDNATHGTLSVNQTNLAAWSALFSGLVAITNSEPDDLRMSSVAQYQNPPPSNSWMIIQPAGPWTIITNSALGRLVNGINQTRTNTSLFPLQSFAHVGDILAAPQFTDQSPFLHWNDAVQKQNGISDEMYEWLPQQTMSLLRCSSSPRYVIYCYGQTLKPAPNSIYTGTTPAGMFGLVTNYQIVSEIATRAVVRFNSALTNIITTNTFNVLVNSNNVLMTGWTSVPVVTNNNAVIESFNPLPPD
jgi:hypothetical protein